VSGSDSRDSVPSTRRETCLIVGGTSGLGRQLARRFAAAGYGLVLLSSDDRDGGALAADLRLRFGVPVEAIAIDLAAAELDLAPLDSALAKLPPLVGLLAPAGMNAETDVPDQPFESFAAVTRANYTGICSIVAHCLPTLRAAAKGFVVGFGSVAATRGRTRNTAYSAAKRALESYFESLRHSLAPSGGVAQFYVLGYLDTNLAFGQRTLLRPASPARLAERVFAHRFDDIGSVYHPRTWWAICRLVRAMPWFVFRRLSF